ncbi:MAG: hypothetical protein OER88_06770 [Planctomycetota bacterium]|nr:hypothetical protein [Planctomycetota bacterium]
MARLLAEDRIDMVTLAAARRLLAAGRVAVRASAPPKRVLKRAYRIFRDNRGAPRRRGSLQLVLDTLLGPIPSVRSRAVAPARFLRFSGDWTLELRISRGARGLTIHGQVLPAGRVDSVAARSGKTTRRASIGDDGTFVLKNLAARPWTLDFGPAGQVEIKP